jgi:hypothetical protein
MTQTATARVNAREARYAQDVRTTSATHPNRALASLHRLLA